MSPCACACPLSVADGNWGAASLALMSWPPRASSLQRLCKPCMCKKLLPLWAVPAARPAHLLPGAVPCLLCLVSWCLLLLLIILDWDAVVLAPLLPPLEGWTSGGSGVRQLQPRRPATARVGVQRLAAGLIRKEHVQLRQLKQARQG